MKNLLDNLDETLSPLARSVEIQARTATVGFDWPTLEAVFNKLQEEIRELQIEIKANTDKAKMQDELGDVLFCCANIARWLALDPEAAMQQANAKFELRYRMLENLLAEKNIDIKNCSFSELLTAWEVVKQQLKQNHR